MADKFGRIAPRLRSSARDEQKGAGPVATGERDQEAAVLGRKGIEPSERKVRNSGVNDDHIGGSFRLTARTCPAVTLLACGQAMRLYYCVLAPPDGVDLKSMVTCPSSAAWATTSGQDGGVVARADADMNDMVSGSEPELIVDVSPETRLPIIEPAVLVDRDQDIVIEMSRVGISGCPVAISYAHRTQQPPGSGPGEVFARHCRKGVDYCWQLHSGGMPEFVSI